MPKNGARAAALALLAVSLGLARNARADEFFGPDKALHFGVSAGLAAGGYALASLAWERPWQRALAGASLALSAGAAKELWDLSGRGDPSWKDLAWDGIGTGVGVGLALGVDLLFFQRRSEGDRKQAMLVVHF